MAASDDVRDIVIAMIEHLPGVTKIAMDKDEFIRWVIKAQGEIHDALIAKHHEPTVVAPPGG